MIVGGALLLAASPVRSQALTIVRGIGEQKLKATEFAPPTAKTLTLRASLSEPDGSLLVYPADNPQAAVTFLDGQTRSVVLKGPMLAIVPRGSESMWALEALNWTDSSVQGRDLGGRPVSVFAAKV